MNLSLSCFLSCSTLDAASSASRMPVACAGAPLAKAQASAAAQGRVVEITQGHVFGDAQLAHAGIAQRLLGQAAHLEPVILLARGGIGLPHDAHAAARAVALAHQRFDQVPLAIAGDACNPEHFTRRHRQAEIAHGKCPPVANDFEIQHRQ